MLTRKYEMKLIDMKISLSHFYRIFNYFIQTPLSLVRWSSISVDDFMDVVLPSNVLDQTELIDVVKKNRENKIYRIPSIKLVL